MKVAVATEGQYVAQHFGHCQEYTIAEIGDGKVLNMDVIPNPGHQPGFLPVYLGDLGISCIIAGGMGARAQELFEARNIVPITGVTGSVREALDAYAAGTLCGGESLCDHGEGEHHCEGY
ncbi:dinitrogenase iron-molybdenum cofactor [Clostridiales bacterium PH28_bin88]|nr:dinitrogenase iron-molybdenum cofactor [Clostridiales bacterium PH28_bin88]